MTTIEDSLAQELSDLETHDQLRSLPDLGTRDGKWIECDERRMLNLSSNDYLGYASDESVVSAFYANQTAENLIQNYAPGSSASRLLGGNHTRYTELETSLEDLYHKPALVFSSGYHANIGLLPSLTSREDLILVDRLAHASILDGIQLTNAKWHRYPHRDTGRLRQLLVEKRAQYRRVFVVTESLFSMDGDAAPLEELVTLKKTFDFALYVDEAHAVGVRGRQGLGLTEELGLIPDTDIIIGTFGKALGGLGAFAVVAPAVKTTLVNTARSLIFTTALPPVIVSWNNWILKRMSRDGARRQHLSRLSTRFRALLTEHDIDTRGESQIIPAILGDNHKALAAAEKLREAGFLAFAIRPPTVPAHASRVRFSLTANIEWADLEGIIPALISEKQS